MYENFMFFLYSGIVFHCMCVSHLVYSFIYYWYSCCFYFLTIANNAAMSIRVQVLFPASFPFFGVCVLEWIAGSKGDSMVKSLKKHKVFSTEGASVYTPNTDVWRFQLLYLLFSTVLIVAVLVGVKWHLIGVWFAFL